MKSMLGLFSLLVSFALYFSPQISFAYLGILESGELIGAGHNRVGVAPQVVSSEGGGFNLDLFVDRGISESTSGRLTIGFGKIDVFLGAAVKWIPFPDVDKQPAMGIKTSAWYGRVDSSNALTVQIAPLVSKKIPFEHGELIGYSAIPFNITSIKDRSYTGTQFAIGAEFKSPQIDHVLWTGEIDFNLKDSQTAFNISASFPFDGSKGLFQRN